MTDEREIPELTEAEKARWDAIRSTIDAMAKGLAEGTLDAEELAATTAKLQQVDVDRKRILDSLHIPEDAGEFHDALVAILRRIPDNWGRWISCDAGWYPLITRLDAALSALDADYQITRSRRSSALSAITGKPRSKMRQYGPGFTASSAEAERQSATMSSGAVRLVNCVPWAQRGVGTRRCAPRAPRRSAQSLDAATYPWRTMTTMGDTDPLAPIRPWPWTLGVGYCAWRCVGRQALRLPWQKQNETRVVRAVGQGSRAFAGILRADRSRLDDRRGVEPSATEGRVEPERAAQ